VDRAPYLFPAGCHLGADNLVLHARATHHRVDGFAGPASIKTVRSGEAAWVIGGRRLLVDQFSFLALSAGETYSMNIAAAKPVETCCVFFAAGFVEQLAADMCAPLEKALDAQAPPPPALPYLSALHRSHDRCMIGRVQNLAERCRHALTPIGFEQEFLGLGMDLLQLYERIREERAKLPAARASTRAELFRRLLIGREYFHSHADRTISLAEVARAASLSLYHFHRSFTRAFQQTPHAYLTQLRLARARQLMEAGSPVLNACLDVGFSSPSAFSRLFRSQYGELPSSVRRKFARSGKHSG
jgi:AraC family transcriptional regulator